MKYILYARKSTEDDKRQVQSIESQTVEMTRLAVNLGLNIVRTFEESRSAKKPNNRPQFTEMIGMLETGEADGIICWKIDRLSRNPIDSGTISWLLQQGKLKVIQTSEKQYLPSDNIILLSLESSMANQYNLDLSKNVKRGVKTKLERGEWINHAPFGYKNNLLTKKIEIDETRVMYIRRAFELYASGGYSLKDISNILYAEGLRNWQDKKVFASTMHHMITNPIYYGVMRIQGKLYPGTHTPIISQQIFEAANEVLEGKTHSKKQKLLFPYRGYMTCQSCGCALTATKKKGKFTYYYCTNGKGQCEQHKNYLPEAKVDDLVYSVFEKLDFDQEIVDLAYEASKEKLVKTNTFNLQAQESLKTRLKDLEERQGRLLETYLKQSISEALYSKTMNDLTNEITVTKSQLTKLEAESDKGYATLELTKEIFNEAILAKERIKALRDEKKRKLAEKLLWNLQLENKEITNFKLKMPYQMLAEAPLERDFHCVLGVVNQVRTKLMSKHYR